MLLREIKNPNATPSLGMKMMPSTTIGQSHAATAKAELEDMPQTLTLVTRKRGPSSSLDTVLGFPPSPATKQAVGGRGNQNKRHI